MRRNNCILLALSFVLVGCDELRTTDKLEITPRVMAPTNQVEKMELFTITSKGTFHAGYENTAREIFILKDNKTGVEYLGVTDCTLVKRIQTKKNAVDTAVDVVLDLLDAVDE